MLYRAWPEQTDSIVWRDVDTVAEWRSRYGPRVPVLILGNQLVCELQPDAQRIARYFGDPINPL